MAEGWQIVARNWRGPGVEVDIIAQNRHRVLIVEVKYRRSGDAGDGFEAVGMQKIAKLERAAALWQQSYGHKEIVVLIASVDGNDAIEFFELS